MKWLFSHPPVPFKVHGTEPKDDAGEDAAP